jgi:hypothetical protein
MRLRAAAGALFPLAGEEKKSKSEAERHRLDSVALAARARQRPQRALKLRPPAVPRPDQRRCPALADHPPAPRQSRNPRRRRPSVAAAASPHGPAFPRQQGAPGPALVRAHLREDAGAIERRELPPFRHKQGGRPSRRERRAVVAGTPSSRKLGLPLIETPHFCSAARRPPATS